MRKVTAGNIASAINQLDKDIRYNYIHTSNKGLIKIEHVQLPEGPISIKRWNPKNGETEADSESTSMSSEMIWRVANALAEGQPINFDRVLAGSYNTRSVLEALITFTPEFYYCYPGRIENKAGHTSIKHGHKHIMWLPDDPHAEGVSQKVETEIVISEMPALDVFYDSLVIPDSLSNGFEIDIDAKRRHSQIQMALYFIGHQLEFRTWIAQNDKGIVYNDKKISEHDGVIASLDSEKLIKSYPDAVKAALLIDCIWFKNSSLMPAVMEVEHSTGVTSGLTRMKNFKDLVPPVPTRYVIVAPDELRDKVVREASKMQFKDMDTKYFPYSAVEELYSLCQRRKIKGVTDDFLDCFMEPILS